LKKRSPLVVVERDGVRVGCEEASEILKEVNGREKE